MVTGPEEQRETYKARLAQRLANALHEADITRAFLSIEDPQLIPRLVEALRAGRMTSTIFNAWTDHPLLARALDQQLIANPDVAYSNDFFPREELCQRVRELMSSYGADSTGFPRAERITRISPYARVKFLNFLISENYCTAEDAVEAIFDEAFFDRLEDRFTFNHHTGAGQ